MHDYHRDMASAPGVGRIVLRMADGVGAAAFRVSLGGVCEYVRYPLLGKLGGYFFFGWARGRAVHGQLPGI